MLNQWETSSVVSASALEQNVKRLMLRYGRVSRRSISMQERDAKNCEDVSSDGNKLKEKILIIVQKFL